MLEVYKKGRRRAVREQIHALVLLPRYTNLTSSLFYSILSLFCRHHGRQGALQVRPLYQANTNAR